MAEQDPETEYLTQRLREIRADLRQSAADLGVSDITPEVAEEQFAFVVEALTRAGNTPLAEALRARHNAFFDAARVLEAAIHREDVPAAATAQEAMNDAQEAYERVEADVNAFLQRTEKGGQ